MDSHAAAAALIDSVTANPGLIHRPELAFLKAFVTTFAAPADHGERDHDDDEEASADDEEADAGLVEADHDEPAPMGDPTRTVTDELREAAALAKAAANERMRAGDLTRALAHFTEAIELAPSASSYADRARYFARLQKPNAAIRDCDAALALNADSAKALKTRGKAYRMLAEWARAHADLAAGQAIDFDGETDGVHRLVAARLNAAREKRQRRLQKGAAHTLLYPGAEHDVTEPFRIPGFPVKRLVCLDPVPGRAARYHQTLQAFFDILDVQAGELGMVALGGTADELWRWKGNGLSMAYMHDTRIEELVPSHRHAALIKECDAVMQKNFWLFRDKAITNVVVSGMRMAHCLLYDQSSFSILHMRAEAKMVKEMVKYESAFKERQARFELQAVQGGAYQYEPVVCRVGSGGRVLARPVTYE